MAGQDSEPQSITSDDCFGPPSLSSIISSHEDDKSDLDRLSDDQLRRTVLVHDIPEKLMRSVVSVCKNDDRPVEGINKDTGKNLLRITFKTREGRSL